MRDTGGSTRGPHRPSGLRGSAELVITLAVEVTASDVSGVQAAIERLRGVRAVQPAGEARFHFGDGRVVAAAPTFVDASRNGDIK